MRLTELANGVFAVHLYDQGFCMEAVSLLKGSADWEVAEVLNAGEDGGVISVSRPEVRMASLLSAYFELEIYKDFDTKMGGVILRLIKHIWGIEFTEHSEAQVIRYGPGGHYQAHTDGGLLVGERYFTVLCYLNDDFEGGATSFPSLGHTVTPQSGKAILFPARYVHCAEPLIAGEKFVMVSWVLGPAPVDWI